MTTPTQLAGFDDITDRLPKCEAGVLDYLRRFPLLTRNELDYGIGQGRPNCQASRRLSKMEERGVIARGTVRPCSITGRQCETWHVTGNAPKPLTKLRTVRQRHEELVKGLEDILRKADGYPWVLKSQVRDLLSAIQPRDGEK
jgi:hypothetical protein